MFVILLKTMIFLKKTKNNKLSIGKYFEKAILLDSKTDIIYDKKHRNVNY